MSTVPLSLFGDSGVDVGSSTRNLTYLYGLSDFFSFMFEDTDTVNLLLEANALTASEIYSRFLQLTSSLSLENIQTFTGTGLKLVLVKSSDQIGSSPKYLVNLPVERVKLLTNRPFLPTEVLEENVDFRVTRNDLVSSYIQFAKPLANYKFSSRVDVSGVKEYAIWLTDVLLDEQLMLKHFGDLVAVTPEVSSEAFSSFIYGLYYVYLNGPTIGLLKRGFNLVLGAPLARANETVFDIRGYLGTEQYLIITDQNQYLLPFGLLPSVNIGDNILLGQLLAEWVQIKDYEQDGSWWLNVTIPDSIIAALPVQQASRFAVAGSPYDRLMREYLYKNTFLVQVTVGNFKNTQEFAQITDIINRSKPSHTQPVYIWVVPDNDLTVHIFESPQSIDIKVTDIDTLGPPIDLFRRNNLISPVQRGGAYFTRSCVPAYVSELVGEEALLGQHPFSYFDGSGIVHTVSGIRAYKSGITSLNTYDTAWTQAASSTGNFMWDQQLNQYSALGTVTPVIPEGYPVFRGFSDYVPAGHRVVALYTTFLSDMSSKLIPLGITSSTIANSWAFLVGGSGGFLSTNFAILFTKTPSLGALGPEFPVYSNRNFSPSIGDVGANDSILCYKISNTVVGVYWITQNTTILSPSLIPVASADPLTMTYTTPINRSGAMGGQPWYLSRGGSLVNWGDTAGSYTDTYNTTPISMNRSMGAPSWPTTGTLTPFNHVLKA